MDKLKLFVEVGTPPVTIHLKLAAAEKEGKGYGSLSLFQWEVHGQLQHCAQLDAEPYSMPAGFPLCSSAC